MGGLAGMRCVVLGAGGFIGTNLCRALAGRVASLKAFGRRQSFPNAMEGIDWLAGDFADTASVSAAIEGSDTIFHLVNASTPASANIDKAADVRANLLPTIDLLDACREAGVRRVVFVSSGGTIYGRPQAVPTDEEQPCWPITGYGISKLAIERYLALYDYLHGLEYRALRVSNPFGPYQAAIKNQGAVAAFLKAALAGEPLDVWGDGMVRRDYVYIDDVVDALLLAAEDEGAERIFNIGSGTARSLNDLVAAIEAVHGAPVERTHRPARAVDVPVSMLDIRRAEAALGWRPRVEFEDGLRRMYDWMRR